MQTRRKDATCVSWTVLTGLWLMVTACGPPTIEEATETPEPTPEASPTFDPGIDVDGDGYGVNEECDDNYDETYPGAEEVCDGRDNDCNGKVDDRDEDQDGYRPEACGGTDCDDLDAWVNPNQSESCNGEDDNCNGEVDEGAKQTFYLDRDEDGYGDPNTTTEACTLPNGYVANGDDCRDQDPDINPFQTETCNGLDDDCNGSIDDGLVFIEYYQDADRDGYGDADSPPFETCETVVPEGYVFNNADCDDGDPAIHPGAPEICNHLDDDCDGYVDQDDPDGVTGYLTFYQDRDGDGYGDEASTAQGCDPPEGFSPAPGDCDDDRDAVHPGADEACNGLDDDCDGERDEGFDRAPYRVDADQDGFGGEEVEACADLDDPEAVLLSGARGDCDDTSALVYPGALDVYGDGTDSDCGGHDAADPHVGLSAASLSTLQTAIEAASEGATVWVGPGTYREAGIDFLGKALSLRSTEGPERTVIDADGRDRVLEFQNGEQPDTVVDGFTITGGTATMGGGVYLLHTAPTLTGCTIEGNVADYGGGLYLLGGSPTLSDLVIRDNEAHNEGGGLYLKSSDPLLVAVTVTQNTAGGPGGGCSLRASSPTIEASTLSDNHADLGGGCYLAPDAAPTWDHTLITENTATRGAGLYFDGAGGTLTNCTIEANSALEDGGGVCLKSSGPTLRNVLVTANSAGQFGGGLSLSTADPVADNLVVTDNGATFGGGVYLAASSPTLNQVLIMRNTATEQGGGIYLIESDTVLVMVDGIVAYNSADNVFNHPLYPANPAIHYSLLYNPDGLENHNLETMDADVLEVEPQFLTYDNQGIPDTWHLAVGSPAVDTGDPGLVDADGSRADLGAFGGAFGAQWDLDGDGVPTYFWPGDLTDAPADVDTSAYEADD